MFILTTDNQHSTGRSSYFNKARKGVQMREEIKVFQFANDMIIYVENSKNLLQKSYLVL